MSTQTAYLHRCLELFAEVTELRYGKRQRLEKVERKVKNRLEDGALLWEVVRTIYDSTNFDAGEIWPVHGGIEDYLKRTTDSEWTSLRDHELIAILDGAFRQIEPVSVVMRFIYPKLFGVMSSPVAALVGVRLERKTTATYKTYCKSLREIGRSHGFERAADVEMALWALQVGALDRRLQEAERKPLEDGYNDDRQLRQLATRNLTKQLFAETGELDVAEALLDTDPALAGKIAGIEFEQLVSEQVLGGSVKVAEKSVSLACCRGRDQRLGDLIRRFRPSDMRNELRHAREVRNRAVHCPRCVAKEDVRSLIKVARRIQNLMR